MDWDIIPADEAADIKHGSASPWKTALIEGKMISMTKRPSWTKNDTVATGQKMRTKTYVDEAGENRFYVWLEKVSAEEMTSITVGMTPPFVTADDTEVPL